MSNKTSDKNVANVTKSDIDILKALINVYEAGLPSCDELLDSEVKALKNVLAEREQDKKRIQELEEELEKANRQLDLDYVEENFIPKQVIKDKIEKIIRETTPTPVFKPKSMWDDTDYERLYKTQPLLELLEGGSK